MTFKSDHQEIGFMPALVAGIRVLLCELK